jgi:serine/threonine-protein kinase
MADVHLARMESAGEVELVALKRVRADARDSPELVAHLEREARIGELLSHPHIVGLRAVGVLEDRPYLALEFVHGRSASALQKAFQRMNSVLPLEAVVIIGRDVASALRYAHERKVPGRRGEGIVHRDVSPDNVLIAYDGISKLADFGIAKVMGSTVLTRTGTLKGKLGYLAPELLEGQEATFASDLFALGATLYTLVCGVTPFQGRSEADLMRAVLSANPAPPGTLRPDLPAAFRELLDRCLAKPPARRPSSAREVLEVLESLCVDLGARREAVGAAMQLAFPEGDNHRTSVSRVISDKPKTESVSMPDRRRRHAGSWAALAMALTAGAGLTVAAATGKLRPLAARPPPLVLPEPRPVVAPFPAVDEEAQTQAQAEAQDSPRERPRPSREISKAKAAPKASGTLLVKVSPWARVAIDGQSAGMTPLAPIALPAGKHRVVLVNEQLDKREVHEVWVRPGQEATLKVILDAAP